MIAAVSAVALLLIMFIFSWFGIGGDLGALAADAGVDTGANAWQSFGFIDIVLFITILAAIGIAVMKANSQSPNLPVAGSALVAGLGILSVLLVLYRIIDPPYDADREIGVFLGLIATAGIAYGGWEAMREEGTSFQAQADRLQNRDAGPGASTGRDVPPPPPPASGGSATPPPPPPRDPGSNPPPAV
jgi:hypothetical protein